MRFAMGRAGNGCDIRRWGVLLTVAALSAIAPGVGWAADWPVYQHDNARSGVTSESLPWPLREAWVWKSPLPPQLAWRGPAKRDPYNKVENLRNRADFDRVFHVVAVGDRVLFGTSVSDQVMCLDAATGEMRWRYFTEGPVRLAPAVAAGRVYCGSDDGYVSCLQLADGELLWRTRIGPRDERLPGNRRLISRWPVRTGVVVADGTVYVAAGMFPKEGVYVVALDATDGSELWRSDTGQLPAQGYLLASATRLYVPSGRNNPIVFHRHTGELLRVVEGAGGTYCLLTGDTLVFGPGKTGQLGVVPAEKRDQLATFRGNHMIVTPEMSYLHSDNELTALDRARYLQLAAEQRAVQAERARLEQALKSSDEASRPSAEQDLARLGGKLKQISADLASCLGWTVPCEYPHALILADTTLVAGGDGRVGAFRTADGQAVWSGMVHGAAHGLAVAQGRLFVSTDSGHIHAFVAGELSGVIE